jgi:hypothetical protein
VSTTDNVNTFILYACHLVEILWNCAHAVGGTDEALRLRWEESCYSHVIFREIWIKTCLANESFIFASLFYFDLAEQRTCAARVIQN